MAGLPSTVSESTRRLNPRLYGVKHITHPDAPVCQLSLGVLQTTDENKLNKTEKAFLAELRRQYPSENIGVQNVTLKLADDTRYTPDFSVIPDEHGKAIFYEVKGFWRDDAKAKIKIAARCFRWAQFVVVSKEKAQFRRQPIKP